jgi:hypothetical protein
MKTFRVLAAGASLLGLTLAAQAWPARDEVVGSVCGACLPGQIPSALALELQYTTMHAHDPAAQRTVIVNQPIEVYEPALSARY